MDIIFVSIRVQCQPSKDSDRLVVYRAGLHPQLTRVIRMPENPPAGQLGDKACPEVDLNHEVASAILVAHKGRMGRCLDG